MSVEERIIQTCNFRGEKKKFSYVSCLRKRQPEHPGTGKIQCSREARGMPRKMAIQEQK